MAHPAERLKRCSDCYQRKPAQDFYQHKKSGDGLMNKCKQCHKIGVRKNRKAKAGYYRSYDVRRQANDNRKAHTQNNSHQWRRENPEKYKAQNRLNNAVRDGKVVKPSRCERCGRGGRLHGHHHDYNKPLEVEWLCPSCHHGEEHREDHTAFTRIDLNNSPLEPVPAKGVPCAGTGAS